MLMVWTVNKQPYTYLSNTQQNSESQDDSNEGLELLTLSALKAGEIN